MEERCQAYRDGKTISYNHPKKGQIFLPERPREVHKVCRANGLADRIENPL